MERAHGALGVLLEIPEVRRVVAVVDAVEDGQVQLHQLLDVVEHAPDRRDLVAGGQLLDRPIGQEVNVELGPDVLDPSRKRGCQGAGGEAGRVDGAVP
jgi:hypothetical protein